VHRNPMHPDPDVPKAPADPNEPATRRSRKPHDNSAEV
jgi:hypothetical protein